MAKYLTGVTISPREDGSFAVGIRVTDVDPDTGDQRDRVYPGGSAASQSAANQYMTAVLNRLVNRVGAVSMGPAVTPPPAADPGV